MDLDGANKAIQGFQNQVSVLEEEKEEAVRKLDSTERETSKIVADKDRCEKELQRAKESLDEIRLMLADTRARAREHYYKEKRKKAK